MSFPIPRPKATPAPTKPAKSYVRGEAFDITTQAIFGRKRMPNIVIENAEQGRSSNDRRWAIQRGGL